MSDAPQTIPDLYEVLVGFRDAVLRHLVKLDGRMDRLEKEARLTRRAVQNLETQLLSEKEKFLPPRKIPRSATSRHPAEVRSLAAKQRD